MKLSFFSFIFLVLFLCVFSSCSKTEPEIASPSMRLVYFQGDAGVYARFSFFVMANDDDGVENLADLYLYHDREGLRWRFSEKDWILISKDGHTWIGSRNVAMVDDEPLPRGQYRAVLVNKVGEQSARTFTFDPPEKPRYPFPALALDGETYAITSKYPAHFFIGYDERANFIQTVKVDTLEGSLADLKIPAKVKAIALWAEDADYATSVLLDIQTLTR
jgi:hypothetical protein